MTPLRLRARIIPIAVLAGLLRLVVSPTPAPADTVWVPSPTNGYRIYLSRACHDRGGDVCRTNVGCQGWDENFGSALIASSATSGAGHDLMNRGYIVRIGDGLTRSNIANSNQWGADLHVPLHTNAGTVQCSSSTSPAQWGTQAFYVSNAGFGCAYHLVNMVGYASPGSRNDVLEGSHLGELTQTTATACYLEAEFHTWHPGVNWLESYPDWTWRIGAAVDHHFSYPPNL